MTTATLPRATRDGALVRAIGRWDLAVIGLNLVVGAGIFGLPSTAFRLGGALSPVALLAAGATAGLIALCFAEVGSRFTQTGGSYLYAHTAFGPFIGFQTGWLRWLSGVAAFAANSNLLVDYLAQFVSIAATVRAPVVAFVIAVLTVLNVASVRHATWAGHALALTKLVVFSVFIIGGTLSLDGSRLLSGPIPGYGAFSSSVLLLFYAFVGFETVTIPGGEIREPRRAVPFALMTVVAFVTLLYATVQIVCIGTVPVPALESSTRPLADAAATFLGGAGATMIAAGALVSIAGNLNAQLLGTPRVLFAMAEHAQIPSILGRTHPHFRTPHVAILCTAGAALLLAISGGFAYLATLSVITRILSYATVCAALPLLRRRDRPPALVHIPWGTAISFLALLACAWLLSSSSLTELRDIAAAIVVGAVLWAIGRRRVPRG